VKKLTFAVTLALALVTIPAVYADKRKENGDRKGGNAGSQGTTRVPEPSSVMLLGSGLLTIGGLLVLARQRLLNPH
jgi:hypothetical protein